MVEKISSLQVAMNQLASTEIKLNGHGKPTCQLAQGRSANQFWPWNFSMPDSQNSHARITRSPSGASHSPTPLRRSRRRCASRSEEHTSELKSLMRTTYAVFRSKKHTSKRINGGYVWEEDD